MIYIAFFVFTPLDVDSLDTPNFNERRKACYELREEVFNTGRIQEIEYWAENHYCPDVKHQLKMMIDEYYYRQYFDSPYEDDLRKGHITRYKYFLKNLGVIQ